MAGIKDVNFIFDTMRQKNLPYWKAYLGSDPLSSYDEGNVEDSIVTLKKLLEAIENQTVRIVVRPKTSKDLGAGGDTKTNVFTYYFETKNLNPNSNYNNSAPVINGLNDETVDRMIQQAKEIERLNHQIELNKLQHQINEIKRSKELEENEDEEEGIGSVMMGIFDELRPYIPHLASKFLGVNIPLKQPHVLADDVAGHTEETTEQKITTEGINATPEQIEQAKKAGYAGKRLMNVDPNFGDRLLLLAELAEKNFPAYSMGCSFVENAVKKLK